MILPVALSRSPRLTVTGFQRALASGSSFYGASYLREDFEPRHRRDGVSCDETDVRLQGSEFALVQGVTHCLHAGVRASARYTNVWCVQGGRWRAVA